MTPKNVVRQALPRTIPWNTRLRYKNGHYFSSLSFETIYVKRENKKNPAPAEEAVTNTAKVCQRVTSSTGQKDRP